MNMIANASILLFFTILVACGSADDAPGTAAKTGIAAAPTEGAPTAEVPDQTADQPATTRQSALMVDVLPPCTATEEGWLAYVKAEAAFYACALGAWESIDLRGPSGAQGEAGVQGPAGAVVTDDGLNWDDALTGLAWRVGGVGRGCSPAYRLPTLAEIRAASDHGMYLVLGVGKPDAYRLAWLSGDDPLRWNFATGTRFELGNGSAVPASDPTPAASYCIKL
jgi:hypothetical protein